MPEESSLLNRTVKSTMLPPDGITLRKVLAMSPVNEAFLSAVISNLLGFTEMTEEGGVDREKIKANVESIKSEVMKAYGGVSEPAINLVMDEIRRLEEALLKSEIASSAFGGVK